MLYRDSRDVEAAERVVTCWLDPQSISVAARRV